VGFSLAYSAILIPQIEAPDSDLEIDKEDTPWLGNYAHIIISHLNAFNQRVSFACKNKRNLPCQCQGGDKQNAYFIFVFTVIFFKIIQWNCLINNREI
jgi:hypothetical protein